MKVSEIFRNGTDEQIAEVLCKLIEANGWDCVKCPVEAYCHKNHNGFLDLLQMDYIDGEFNLKEELL